MKCITTTFSRASIQVTAMTAYLDESVMRAARALLSERAVHASREESIVLACTAAGRVVSELEGDTKQHEENEVSLLEDVSDLNGIAIPGMIEACLREGRKAGHRAFVTGRAALGAPASAAGPVAVPPSHPPAGFGAALVPVVPVAHALLPAVFRSTPRFAEAAAPLRRGGGVCRQLDSLMDGLPPPLTPKKRRRREEMDADSEYQCSLQEIMAEYHEAASPRAEGGGGDGMWRPFGTEGR